MSRSSAGSPTAAVTACSTGAPANATPAPPQQPGRTTIR
jgi:hypothetical protein